MPIKKVILILALATQLHASEFHEIFTKANDCYYQQDFDKAIALYRRALNINSGHAPTHFNLGITLSQSKNNPQEALEHFKLALSYNPHYFKAAYYLGTTNTQLNNHQEALIWFKRALEIDPQNLDVHEKIAEIYIHLKEFDHAKNHLSKVIEHNPEDLVLLSRLAYTLTMLHEDQQALDIFLKILDKHPNSVNATYNAAYLLRKLNKDKESIPYYLKAIAIDPSFEMSYLGLAKSYFAIGDFPNGCKYFEWRNVDTQAYFNRYRLDLITHEKLQGSHVWIRPEWGLGDMTQFLRFAKTLKDLGVNYITVQTFGPLVELFKTCPFVDHVVDNKLQTIDSKAIQIPMMSLPLIVKTTVETIPAPIPYLKPNPELVKFWEPTFDKNYYNVGLCWHAKNIFLEEHPWTKRSIELAQFAPLTTVPNVRFYSLQKVNGTDELDALPDGFVVHSFGQDFDESHGRFMDTAAVIEHLDLVISVDTSIVHVAGALGAKVWVLLPYTSEWRWLRDRNDTPWYPNMRLFRQPEPCNWQPVIQQVTDALKEEAAIF